MGRLAASTRTVVLIPGEVRMIEGVELLGAELHVFPPAVDELDQIGHQFM